MLIALPSVGSYKDKIHFLIYDPLVVYKVEITKLASGCKIGVTMINIYIASHDIFQKEKEFWYVTKYPPTENLRAPSHSCVNT